MMPVFPHDFANNFSSEQVRDPYRGPVHRRENVCAFSLSGSFNYVIVTYSLVIEEIISFSCLTNSGLSAISLSY